MKNVAEKHDKVQSAVSDHWSLNRQKNFLYCFSITNLDMSHGPTCCHLCIQYLVDTGVPCLFGSCEAIRKKKILEDKKKQDNNDSQWEFPIVTGMTYMMNFGYLQEFLGILSSER